MTTPLDVINEVRKLTNDTRAPQRFTDAQYLGFVNQTFQRMAMLRPDLFTTYDDAVTTVEGVTVQSLPSGAFRLVDVFGVTGGNAIIEVDRETLDRGVPGWRSEAAGQPTNYMRNPRNPTSFFLYPAPAAGVTLQVEYAAVPTEYALGDTITGPVTGFIPALIDGTVYLSEAIDTEHVNSGRAKLFYDAFVNALGVAVESREVTDNDEAGLELGKVS